MSANNKQRNRKAVAKQRKAMLEVWANSGSCLVSSPSEFRQSTDDMPHVSSKYSVNVCILDWR